ncbi:hypothetical protein CJF42_25260 [Pseudoalteromonas sp. NBT06-2]|uniref:DUF2971 domain-containing protein n=1 Tax=Pseudoalteromonas sp. NBT06-2 TaxID=2025950 RepID=UPI000BA541FC|nr:DUF2971 domain-containing protein [Pseudoalteromonas sp. NBT06-2]PAJ71706.1 hypothetical protein CJF42_25260 [Pseudoalteromonas sp. NBT06-2]
MNIEEFKKIHPWPDQSGLSSLFRFMPISAKNTEFVEHLFLKKKLYHSLSSGFNDPFEGKPHFNMEAKGNKHKAIKQHLINVARESGMNKKDATTLITNSLKDPQFIPNSISEATNKTFNELRICSFTTDNDNLLFWSHYANSHKGICIEFDASIMPIAFAYKVDYSEIYPQITYPIPPDERAFRPALVKAKVWEYENEYRTMFIPNFKGLPTDGESLLLDSCTITNVYLGSEIDDEDKNVLLDIILKSDFNPNIWQASLAKTSFSLQYKQLN